jgi:hypothetical protein
MDKELFWNIKSDLSLAPIITLTLLGSLIKVAAIGSLFFLVILTTPLDVPILFVDYFYCVLVM